MFLFEWTFLGIIGVIVYTAILIVLYELTRWKKELFFAMYFILPIVLILFVWPTTAKGQPWFNYVKTFSVLIPAITYRWWSTYFKTGRRKWIFILWFLLLAINIFEAVYRDYEVGMMNGVFTGVDIGVLTLSGPWNYMNAVAGILNIITITGFMGGIIFTQGKGKKGTDFVDAVIPDMPWFWIVAYDIWNFAFLYNCLPYMSAYAGLALLAACTIPAMCIKKGTWLQARGRTLGAHCMAVMTIPFFFGGDATTSVATTQNPDAHMLISGLSLAINIAVFVYQIYYMRKHNRTIASLLTHDLYHGTKEHKKLYMENMDIPEEHKEAAYAHFGKHGYKGIFYGWQRFHPFASITPIEDAFEKEGKKNWIITKTE